MKIGLKHLVIVSAVLLLTGCGTLGTVLITEEAPTIAHVHIGHAITGWKHSPEQKGLFQVAEKEAEIAMTHAGYAVHSGDNKELIQLHVSHVMNAIDPASWKLGPGSGFGMKRALAEAVDHITYAAESDDASENVIAFAGPFAGNAKGVAQRSDLILAIGEEVLQDISVREAKALAEDIFVLTSANVEGIDKDKDGKISDKPDECGIKQLRRQLDAMIDREDPPYELVAKRYLFGLIRLPNGKWDFSWNVNRADDNWPGGGDY